MILGFTVAVPPPGAVLINNKPYDFDFALRVLTEDEDFVEFFGSVASFSEQEIVDNYIAYFEADAKDISDALDEIQQMHASLIERTLQ